ncbi:cyclic nucleotide-binding domain-containing protein [Chloropicon primus]|nr:cyclic nucleotide-binding domain-containing protein [Chloropicon primus]
MRFSLFNKPNKVQAINDEDVGSPMDVASRADESFPDEDEGQQFPGMGKGGGNRKSRFVLKSFFKGGNAKEGQGKREKTPELATHRMLGINTLITDSFYQDKEDEADEWRSQMDLFADAYETESVAQSRNSLTPAADDVKVTNQGRKKKRPSFMEVADKNQSYLIRSLFGEMPSQPNTPRLSVTGSRRRSIPKRVQSFNLFNFSFKDARFGNAIHPFGAFRQNWDTMCMLLIAYTMILLPVRFAFYWNRASEDWDWYKTFDTIIDFFFCADVILNFYTGYIDERLDTIILKRDKIVTHYLKTTFILDLLASFPYELVQGIFVLNLTGVLRLWRLTRLMRLLRLQRMFRYSKRMAFLEKVPVYIKRMGNMFCLVFVFAHWNACFQYFVAELTHFPENSWVTIDGIIDETIFEKYSWCLFRAFSHMLCIGYGHTTPQNVSEVWVVQISMVSGASIYALFVGIIATLMIQVDASTAIYNQKIDTLKQYAQHRRLPNELTKRILSSFNLRWKKYKAFDEAEVLDCLPASIKTEVCLFAARDLVKSLPFLHNAEEGLILMLVNMLKPQTFIKKELIIREGEVAKEMYFLNEGTVQVESNGTIITLLRRGSYFGEIGLLRQSKRVASVRAKSNVDAYALTKEDFVTLMTHYPDSAVAMGKIAEHRKYNLDKAKSRKSTMPGANKNKSFLESVEELEKISMQTDRYKRSRTVSRMKEFLARRNSLYNMPEGEMADALAINKLQSEMSKAAGGDSEGGSEKNLSPGDGPARQMSTVIESESEGVVAMGGGGGGGGGGSAVGDDVLLGEKEQIDKLKSELAKRELQLQKKELEVIEREERIEVREKNLSMMDDLDGLTRDDVNLEDNEPVAKIDPPSSTFPNIITTSNDNDKGGEEEG